MTEPVLITDPYRAEQAALHERGNYGTAALEWGEVISAIVNTAGAKTLTDYGCGSRCSLLDVVSFDHPVRVQLYDPAVERFSKTPIPTEMVACIDVLEHIEPDCLDAVLADLRRVTERLLIATIHTGPALKVLTDGRNAHLTQQGPAWWLPRLFSAGFDLLDFNRTRTGCFVVLEPTGD